MKKQLRTHPALKALAVILALVLGAGGFWAKPVHPEPVGRYLDRNGVLREQQLLLQLV